MAQNNPKVLVLGGTGAMGAYLVPELLGLHYEVFVTSRSERMSHENNLHYIKGDAKDDDFLADTLSQHAYDAVVDFMLYTTDEFEKRYKRLLKSTKHYLYLSSYRVYGESGKEPLNEEFPHLIDTLKDKKYLATDEYALAKSRQEKLLKTSGRKNWTILRPAITYSRDRFFLGGTGTEGFLLRALKGKGIIFPKEILDKETTMTWAGDAAKMISLLVCNRKAFGEAVNVSTSEHHTWAEVLKYYKDFLNVRVRVVPMEDYIKVHGLKYMLKYNRMYNRMVDNTKVLSMTGIRANDLMPLNEGLRMELAAFSRNVPKMQPDKEREQMLDRMTTPYIIKLREKLKPRTRVRQVKSLIDSRMKFDGAIVTLTVYNNYGNVLQRFALQRFLMKNNYNFNMFDFHSKAVKKYHKELKLFCDRYLTQQPFNPRLARFYKAYIVGSDQVWRHFSVNKGWENFGNQFLSFVRSKNARRIAYAASFGVDTLEAADITGKRKNNVSSLIKKFDAISVREHSGLGLVEELGGKAAAQTLDPTLLLKAADYERLINDSKHKDKKSSPVFYYLIDPTDMIQATIAHYENETSSKSDGVLPYLGPYRGISLPSMAEWLKGIRDSKIVITDSYHAVVFSIIFHTDFIVFDKKGGGLARITELLEPLGLADRIVIQTASKKAVKDFKKVDWKRVDSILEKKRRESADWLLSVLPAKK